MTDLSPFVDEWTHGCDALLNNITLWIPRCPHCGKPAPTSVAPPRPQASAEDVALVDEVMRGWPKFREAWQRIRADYERMGVVK